MIQPITTTTIASITSLARRVFRQREYVRPLGRWGVEKNPAQQEYVSNWASADHCGVCMDHLTEITKSQTPGVGRNVIHKTNE